MSIKLCSNHFKPERKLKYLHVSKTYGQVLNPKTKMLQTVAYKGNTLNLGRNRSKRARKLSAKLLK